MAYMVPDTIPRLAIAGERILFQTLREDLPSDYIVYYKPEIQGRRPDFVVIGPDLGLVVLEVRDYTRNMLQEMDQNEWALYTAKGDLTTVKSPLKQARDHAQHLEKQLRRDKVLIQLQGVQAGQLKFACGFGAVFTRMKRADFVRYDLYEMIPADFVFCQDEIDPEEDGYSQENLVEKLLGMFSVWSRRFYRLTSGDVRAIRHRISPQISIGTEGARPISFQDQMLLSLHNIQTMDMHQETLAEHLGDRHRLIRGVAGSGKTILLAGRAKMLAKLHPNWKILVLCYGIPLSLRLRQMIDRMLEQPVDLFDLIQLREETPEMISSRIEVYNFREWLRNKLQTREEHIPILLDMLQKKEAILPTYDAILIDEGQEFESDWLRLLGQVLNPATQSLLLVEDRAQSGFKRKTSLAQDTGLDFRGRSKVLTINYRNTTQIVQFAWDFYNKHSQLKNKMKLGTARGVEIIPPQSTRRRGPEPRIVRCASFVEEMQDVAAQIELLHRERHMPYDEMLILYRVKDNHKQSFIDDIQGQLLKSNIPFTRMKESMDGKDGFTHREETVKLSTIDGAKGLDFRAVFIVNIENMPFSLEEVEEREVSLFYIGMTRALDWLSLSYSGESTFTKYLEEIRVGRKRESDPNSRMG
ncbi:3'-5' exonuclease [Paenibacillus filicis]|uniref:3'-5' exonuclease n=1 Tax=Paenibacillus filicis TaxID=669464 RepID=A0ABU9DNA9_9BACL